MYRILFFSLLLFANNIFAASVAVPTITNSVSAGTTFKFTVTLSGKLLTGYKVKIDLNNGKGLVAMICSGMTCTLSSNTLPKDVNSVPYKVGVYDSKGVLQGITTNGIYKISESVQLDQNTNGLAIYTKISNSGAELPDTAKLGRGANDWACTKDNKTGLIWEVKTNIGGGLRDWNKTYTNYSDDYPQCNLSGDMCKYYISSKYGDVTNTDGFVTAVNNQSLCGARDWRLPTRNELISLVYCSDGKYNNSPEAFDFICSSNNSEGKDVTTTPTINPIYFPNTQALYWSSEKKFDSKDYFWYVAFVHGSLMALPQYLDFNVRLVR